MAGNPLAADLNHVLEHTRHLWEELRGERIFITGGTGFFGCWLLESFAWANERLGLKASALVSDPEAWRLSEKRHPTWHPIPLSNSIRGTCAISSSRPDRFPILFKQPPDPTAN